MEVTADSISLETARVPRGWNVDRIGNLASITTGTKNTQDRISGGKYPFFVRSQKVERINSYSFDGEAILTAGDGVGTGKVFHYIKGKFDFHQRVYKLSDFRADIDGYFLYLYFSNNFYNRIMQMTAKSSVDSVRMEMISEMPIPIPPKAEQTAIATALSDTDALISSLEKLIAKKRNIKQGVMQELLRPKQKWSLKRIGDIADVVGGGTPSTFITEYWNGDIDWFTPTEIGITKYVAGSGRKITKKGLANCGAQILPEGTVLLTSRAGIGDAGILKKPACTNQGFQSLVAKHNTDSEYLYYLALTLKPILLQNASGSTFLEISPSKIRQIEVYMPTKEEQREVSTVLCDLDLEISAMESKLFKSRLLKQGMMQALLTGKIRLL